MVQVLELADEPVEQMPALAMMRLSFLMGPEHILKRRGERGVVGQLSPANILVQQLHFQPFSRKERSGSGNGNGKARRRWCSSRAGFLAHNQVQ